MANGKKLREKIRDTVNTSFLYRLLVRYPENSFAIPSPKLEKKHRFLKQSRLAFARGAENSHLTAWVKKMFAGFLSSSLRSLAIFFMSLGVYSSLFWLFQYYLNLGDTSLSALVWRLGIIAVSIPLFFSNRSIVDELQDSLPGHLIFEKIGLRFDELKTQKKDGHPILALVLGFLCAALAVIVPIYWILLALGTLFIVVLIFYQPEISVPLICLLIPFVPTLALVCLVGISTLALLVKVFRGNRLLNLELSDGCVLAFGLFLLGGGIASVSTGSIFPALVFVCFLCGYFLITTLMKTEEALHRCVSMLLFGAALVSAYGILQYFTGNFVSASSWLDKGLFQEIPRRAVSTLENPNMLGEYLSMLLPLALCSALKARTAVRRFASWSVVALMIVCLGLTFSRGAWVAGAVVLILFLCVETRRLLPAVAAAALSVPLFIWVFPNMFLNRLLSIGNLADSSIQYRLNIWRGTLSMLKDFFLEGIGIGESAWEKIYPSYALEAIESAPHSHQLFLQITVEIGIVGLLLFLVALFVHWQSLVTVGKTVREMSESRRYGPKKMKQIGISRAYGQATLCGIMGACVFGLFDYSWYNYRVFLLFWMVLGLSSAYVRCVRKDDLSMVEKSKPVVSSEEAVLEVWLGKNTETEEKEEEEHEAIEM